MTPSTNPQRMRIAVVGSGISGISAAWYLSRRHDVVLIERDSRLGGHTNTITLESGPDAGARVDTGFIVLNDETYGNFKRFLAELEVPTRVSTMSFSYWNKATNFHYGGNTFNGLFSDRRHLVSPRFWAFLSEVVRFNRASVLALETGTLSGKTIQDFLSEHSFSNFLLSNYVMPLTAAVWSTPPEKSLQFPAETLLRFFFNHGILRVVNRPTWRTVVGGSVSYVEAFLKRFKGEIRLNQKIRGIERGAQVVLHYEDRPKEEFDRVVIATHADQALRLLSDPSEDEQRLLGAWKYTPNDTVLHSDSTVMPPHRRAWCSWNFHQLGKSASPHLSMTYHMNTLQGLKTKLDYFVTLNREDAYRAGTVIRELHYTHPVYDFGSLATQEHLPTLNGNRCTYFAGSYFGYGFHEDGIRSAVQVARAFGISP
ncbi:MAG: FAD-dependent oxidoreductase [Candidatus Sumerlaeia bacterium]|nr:FAD-dependent oxidoreductase [Candidatus Sumerlaeia bacterium]